MIHKLLAATAITLCLGGAALAQSGSDTSTQTTAATSGTGVPSDWSSDITGAFFSDPAKGTLKSQDEIKSGWSSLSSDQQAMVRSDCQKMSSTGSTTMDSSSSTDSSSGSDTGMSASSDTGTSSGASGTMNNSGSNTADAGTSSGATTGTSGTSGTATASTDMNASASMTQLCDWVDTM